MGILADILGTGKVIEEGFKLIDSIHTSDEEEIAAKVKGKTELLKAYHPFKKAQRVLAFLFAGNFIPCFWLVLYFSLTWEPPAAIYNEAGMLMNAAATQNTPASQTLSVMNQFYIGEIMLTIIIFYFGGGFLEGAITKAKSKGE